MDLASELRGLRPRVGPSPWQGFEHVKGYGVMALPFASGHVLALRVFPENDFAPYTTIWHRFPDKRWEMFVDSARTEVACPRYFGAALSEVHSSRIQVTWPGSAELRVVVDRPELDWRLSLADSPLPGAMNRVLPHLPEGLWRSRAFLKVMERMAGLMFGMGAVTLHGVTPNGNLSLLMPRRIFFVADSRAVLAGEDLGRPVRARENPMMGDMGLPARPTFAVGEAYFQTLDRAEYERTARSLRAEAARDGREAEKDLDRVA